MTYTIFEHNGLWGVECPGRVKPAVTYMVVEPKWSKETAMMMAEMLNENPEAEWDDLKAAVLEWLIVGTD